MSFGWHGPFTPPDPWDGITMCVSCTRAVPRDVYVCERCADAPEDSPYDDWLATLAEGEYNDWLVWVAGRMEDARHA